MQRGTIYTLTDPRNGQIHYVGKTTKPVLERLAGHLASPSNPAMRVWFNALALQAMTPHINAISTPSLDKLAAEEEKQIRLHAEAGHRLFNSPYYHQNMAALVRPVTAATPQALKLNGSTSKKITDFSHTQFGRIAAARVAGKMSRTRATFLVLLNVPVVSLVILWHALVGVRPVRIVMKTALLTYGLWSLGFDHLLRDKVVAYLPLADGLAFWHEYLARPMTNLGWLATASLLLTAVVEYHVVADSAKASAPRTAEQPRAVPAPRSGVDTAAAAAAALDGALAAGRPPASVSEDLLKQRSARPEAPKTHDDQD
jgi:hypothetical protein